jgi:hypothetical protein
MLQARESPSTQKLLNLPFQIIFCEVEWPEDLAHKIGDYRHHFLLNALADEVRFSSDGIVHAHAIPQDLVEVREGPTLPDMRVAAKPSRIAEFDPGKHIRDGILRQQVIGDLQDPLDRLHEVK